MKKKILYFVLPMAAVLLLVFACPGCSGIATGITKVTDAITQPTAREVYAREFKGNEALFNQWEMVYKNAISDSLEVNLPYGEKGIFNQGVPTAYSYSVKMEEGEVLVAEIVKDSVNQRIFTDVFAFDGAGFKHLKTFEPGAEDISIEVNSSGIYKIIIQPEMAANTNFFINIYKKPLLNFPVLGKGNAAVMSFWGMERDGGKRTHEGIDIFAKKGTPVIAVADGTISRTGNHGIGGKQVWQRVSGYSLYYAHLDSVVAQSGRTVKAGDTLGFVGNTGNAKFTPPHLHFGIYKGYSGAVNPLPFVYETAKVKAGTFSKNFAGKTIRVKGNANLRKGPQTTFGIIGSVAANDIVTLLGESNDWLHIQTASNQKAFLHKSLVKAAK